MVLASDKVDRFGAVIFWVQTGRLISWEAQLFVFLDGVDLHKTFVSVA